MFITKTHESAVLPTRKNPTDAGLDLYSVEKMVIPPHSYGVISTGIAIELPSGSVGLLFPKSRHNYLIGAGVIDAEYRGTIYVKIVNGCDQSVLVMPGDPVAQLVILPVLIPAVFEIPYEQWNTNTSRGTDGGIVRQLKTATFDTPLKGEQ